MGMLTGLVCNHFSTCKTEYICRILCQLHSLFDCFSICLSPLLLQKIQNFFLISFFVCILKELEFLINFFFTIQLLYVYLYINSVQSLSPVRLFVTLQTAALQASLSNTNSRSLLHQVGDAIQPSHPLLSPSPPAFNLSPHQGLFQWVSSSHQVAKVLELQLQHQSFQ